MADEVKEVQIETPAPSEAEQVKAELEKTRKELLEVNKVAEQHKKGLQTLERELRDRESKLKEFGGIQDQIQAIREDNKLLAGYIASMQGKPEDDFEKAKESRDTLLKTFDEREKQRADQRKQKESEQRAETFRKEVEAMGLTRKDDEYWQMYDLVVTGNFTDAEARLQVLKEKKQMPETKEPEQTKPKESEEDRINRLVNERLQKAMEEKGLFTSDAGTPSGKPMNYSDAAVAFSEGRIDRKTFEKYRNK